jgi:hypothetical protein
MTTKAIRAKMAAYDAILRKHNIYNLSTDQLYSALYTEFSINDWDLLLMMTAEEREEIVADTNIGRQLLVDYYKYAAECAVGLNPREAYFTE